MGYPGLPLRYSQLVIKPKLTYPKLTLPLGLPPGLPPGYPLANPLATYPPGYPLGYLQPGLPG